MHIHLDPVGGVAGDMFIAALLDTFPELEERVRQTIGQADQDGIVDLELLKVDDDVLTGSRFHVRKAETKEARDEPSDPSHHTHHHWSSLRERLMSSALPDGVKKHVLGIFGELAKAEAQVHGKDVDAVVFHEVGNWDSIADIVGAATLIDALGVESWSVGSLPIGRGLVKTAHGELPVPAPATILLLDGFSFHDDGRPGERVTPTGAAILRYLSPSGTIGPVSRRLGATGFGFGARKLEGMSNTLRILAFDVADDLTNENGVGVIQFEIDDQTGEELAVSLDHIRADEGVIDATQATVFGKKGRLMTSIQVLTKPNQVDAVAETCFRQTSTLGLRTRIERRMVLAREEVRTAEGARVKVAARPGGVTAKTEMDEVTDPEHTHKTRRDLRLNAEKTALER